jgi:uncharacterized surface protein with fasciclin (FAS1) repeats
MSSQDQETKGLGTTPVRDKNAVHDLWYTLEADQRFRRFLKAAADAQLEAVLHGPDWLTVFAFPDDAATNETEESLRALVPQHVVRGYQTEADLRTAGTVRSLQGPAVAVSWENGRAQFGDATVQEANIACSNGMLHVLSRPMLRCSYSG